MWSGRELTDREAKAVLFGAGAIVLLGAAYTVIAAHVAGTETERRSAVQSANAGPIHRIEDVFGGTDPEEFYDKDGKRVFLKIDGVSIKEVYGPGVEVYTYLPAEEVSKR
jgi:hypothetical protein